MSTSKMIGMMKKTFFSRSEKAPKAQVNSYHSYRYILHIIDLVERLFGSSALLDLVNVMQVGLDLPNATGAKNLLSKFTEPDRARYSNLLKTKIWETRASYCLKYQNESCV